MKKRDLLVSMAVVTLLAGCTTIRQTQPSQTAREQLLLSAAVDHASARIHPDLAPGASIFVDTSHFAGGDEYRGQYAIETIRMALLNDGYRLVDKQKNADVIAQIGSGALSIDKRNSLFGIPSAKVPIPFSGPLNTPEVAFWKSEKRTGVAKFLIAYYDAKTGAMVDTSQPIYGFSHYDRSSIFFYGRTSSDLMPAEAEKRRENR